MTIQSLLAHSLVGRLGDPASRTRDAVATLSEELSTGRVADAGMAMRHDFSALAQAERDLAIHASLRGSVQAGQRLASAAGASFDRIGAEIDLLREAFKPHVTGGAVPGAAEAGAAAEGALRQILAALDLTVDGRAVMAGGRTDVAAHDGADALFADLDALAAAAPDAATLRADVRAYFEGGAYAAARLPAGSPAGIEIRTGIDAEASWRIGMDDPAVIAVLAEVGEAVALTRSAFADDAAARDFYATGMPGNVARAADGAIALRARTGALEARLDAAAEALERGRFDAEGRRDALVGADPYETATRLQDETARLETVYTLTARLSRLRLTDYL